VPCPHAQKKNEYRDKNNVACNLRIHNMHTIMMTMQSKHTRDIEIWTVC